MDRRKFINIMGLGVGTVVLSSSLICCSSQNYNNGLGWNNSDLTQEDIRLKLLSYAMLCPNPHNKQPWLIRFTGDNSFSLYVDKERVLPATDPHYRQIHIGHGTFLETLEIAASGFGYEVKIDYFPEGRYSNTELSGKAVAAIELIRKPDIKVDPLFSQIIKRHSNKREYGNLDLSAEDIKSISDFHNKNNHSLLKIDQSKFAQQQFNSILPDAMQIEVGNRARDIETIKMFRFNDGEVEKYRDGFGLAQSGIGGVSKFFAETFSLSRKSVEEDPTFFGKQSVDMIKDLAASTNCFAWLTTSTNSRLDQLKVGRDYCRINLKTSSLSLAQHPVSQVLEEYEDMKSLQLAFKESFKIKKDDTVQMLFRLGRATPTKHGPRRVVHSIIANNV